MDKFLEELENNIQKTCFCEDKDIECSNEYKGISKLPKNPVVAMAYVPFQTCTDEYDVEKIPLSNDYGLELFFSKGTKAVMPDLIKYVDKM